MGSGPSGFASCILLFVLLVLQCAHGSAREITEAHWNDVDKEVSDLQHHAWDDHLRIYAKQDDVYEHQGIQAKQLDEGNHQYIHKKHVHDHPVSHMDHMDPSLNVFFTVNDLKVGRSMPIFFPIKDPSTSPHILPREEADSIPFSLSQLSYLLEFFSFPQGSPQAQAMEETLTQCEVKPIRGETKFCATSLESMLDSTHDIFGLGVQFKVLSTTRFTRSSTPLQNYTILEVPKEFSARKMVACHMMPYPYAVFYCHSQESENKLFEILLGCENGEKVKAVAVCHMDTSQWDPDHVAFRLLKIQPRRSPVCHFFPADNLVWVPSPSVV